MRPEQRKPMPLIVGMLTSLAAGIALIFFNKYQQTQRERPPRKAPQLDIENPGNQDEFPTSTTEEEMMR